MSGKKYVLAAIATTPLWFIVGFLLYGPSPNDMSQQDLHVRNDPNSPGADISSSHFWKTADMLKNDVPKDVLEKSKSITVNNKTLKVDGVEVFYREAIPDGEVNQKISLLLLHGMAFSSETWLKLGTLQILAAMGYKTVAVDLPGYGKSPAAQIPDRGQFVVALSSSLGLKRPVIVSPSMSGTYSLRYLLKHYDQMGGYVPVAPVGIDVLEQYECPDAKEDPQKARELVPDTLKQFLQGPVPNLGCVKTPALVVYGEHDRSKSSALLCLLPLSQAAEIPNGKHPAYLDNPPLWHKLLFNFLGYVVKFHELKG